MYLVTMSSRGAVVGVKRGRSSGSVYDEAATIQLKDLISEKTYDQLLFEKIIFFVEKKGANPNVKCRSDKTALMVISWMGRNDINGPFHDKLLKTFKFLLGREDIDLNVMDNSGTRAIHIVVGMKDPTFLRLLLENRSVREDINVLDLRRGLSPLHIACSNGLFPIISIQNLLRYGADPNVQGRYGRTPLHLLMVAYERSNSHIGELCQILDFFSQCPTTILGLRDVRGRTVLHHASMCIYSGVVIDKLLRMGEYRSLDLRDIHGFTPVNKAEANHNNEAMTVFRQWRFRQVG